jgi:hypothetical protein
MTTQPADVARFANVALEAIRTFVPADYKVEVRPEGAEWPDCGSDFIRYYTTGVDAPAWQGKKIVIPTPVTPLCLFIAMHEVGHIASRHGRHWRPGMEQEASAWAKKWIESKGLLVPQDVLALAAGVNAAVEAREAAQMAGSARRFVR